MKDIRLRFLGISPTTRAGNDREEVLKSFERMKAKVNARGLRVQRLGISIRELGVEEQYRKSSCGKQDIEHSGGSLR